MDAEAFRAARRELGLTEIGFGNAFSISRRTVQNWSKKGPPPYIAELLQLALVTRIAGPGADAARESDAVAKLSPALNSLLSSAIAAGWDKGVVIAAVEAWALSQRSRAEDVNHK
eukprot:TRINITY_DN77183_c0_g1_i1.p2 TRINITY_DN77183_c0_g1~~TRINITY_DN77183_c0_g1_i1.p2  ORF type:complete len:115 (+),score=11.41 TRINITY_DN77183_c0_g1_i1:181-525(+)